ncbi:MAG: hypothetical protein WCT37_00920 [Patescibacteria group bacterium]
MEKISFSEPVEPKPKKVLKQQLERVNQFRQESGKDILEFEENDFLLSEAELKNKYGLQFDKYLEDLKNLRSIEATAVKATPVTPFDRLSAKFFRGPKSEYLLKLFKHDRRTIKDFENRLAAQLQTEEFQTFLKEKEINPAALKSKKEIKNYVLLWLSEKYQAELEKQLADDDSLGDESGECPLPLAIEKLETSFTAKYAREWGPERIALDGVQNHLAADSGGTKTDVSFLADGQWVDLKAGQNLPPGAIDAIRFRDDGRGYNSNLLKFAYSHQKDDKKSVGEFGEGLKMICAAALSHGMQVRLRSRNWLATPALDKVAIDEQEIQALSFTVEHFEEDQSIVGSETIFTSLNVDFIREVQRIQKKVLALNLGEDGEVDKSAWQETCSAGGMSLENPSWIYVKGMFVREQNNPYCLLSYNLQNVRPNRDRNVLNPQEMREGISEILSNCRSAEVFRVLLGYAFQYPTSYSIGKGGGGNYNYSGVYEFDECSNYFKDSRLLRQAFEDFFGPQAVVYSNELLAKKAEKQGFNPIQLNFYLADALRPTGVKFDWDVAETEVEKELDTSLTLEYEKDKWGVDRIVLDGIQNHMPGDSGGSQVKIQFLVAGEWLDWQAGNQPSTESIKAIRFSDDGRGFDVAHLQLLASSKTKNRESVGQFGEGMKMAAAACLRNNIKQTLESRNWLAEPIAKGVYLDNERVQQLAFKVTEFKDRKPIVGSRTTYRDIPPEFIEAVKNIQEKVLYFDKDYQPLDATAEGDIVRVGGGKIYVKGFQVTDREKDNLIFSYDLPLDTSRDREMLEVNNLKENIGRLLGQTNSAEVVAALLDRAGTDYDTGYFEFQDISASSAFENRELWRQVFEKRYGQEKVVLKSHCGQDWAAIEARFMGYRVVRLNSKITETMRACGILYDYEVAHSETNFEWAENLNAEEKEMLALQPIIDEILEAGGNQAVPIKVYDRAINKNNNRDSQIAGFYSEALGLIGMCRSELRSLGKFLETYLEEKGHQISGGPDGSRELFNYVIEKLVPYIIKDVKSKKEKK